MLKSAILTAAICALFGANAWANAVDDEIDRLAGLRDYRIRQCVSPECRERQKAKFQISVAKLLRDPQLYFATLDLKAEQRPCMDPDAERKIRLACRASWSNDREIMESCIEQRLKVMRRECEFE